VLKQALIPLALCLVDSAAAAQPAQDELTSLPLEQLMQFEVDSVSKFLQKAADAPATISIVTAQDIKAYGYRTLGDILNSMRGLHVSNDRNYSYVGTRGFAVPGDYNTRVLLLVDGVRYNDGLYDQAPIGRDFGVDVDLIDRVEFISGPASAVYGSNALLGVINVITKNGGNFLGPNVAASTGSYDTREGRATIGNATPNGAMWLLSASRFTQDGQDLYYPEFDTPAQNNGIAENADYNRATTVLAKYRLNGFAVRLMHVDTTKGVPTASYDQTFNDNRSKSMDARTNLNIEYQRALNSTVSATGRLYLGHYTYEGDYVYEDGALINRDTAHNDWIGGEAQLLIDSFEHHKLVVGSEYRYVSRIDQENFDVNPRFDYLDDNRSATIAGFYIQDSIALGERWILNLGNRLDRTADHTWTNNPRAGLIFQPDAQTSAKLLYGSAYRTPNAYERYYNAAVYPTISHSDLDNERITARELIIERAFNAAERISFSLFRNNIDRLIVLREGPAEGSLTYVNAGRVTTSGTEVEWQNAWSPRARLKISYSWQRTDDDSVDTLISSPHHLLKLNLTGALPGKLSYGIAMRAISARDTFDGHAPGYGVVDLTLRHEITDQLEIAATLYNALDKRYYDPSSAEHEQDMLQQDRRNFRVKMDYWF
jgi:iron complex outermembrane receptor protein